MNPKMKDFRDTKASLEAAGYTYTVTTTVDGNSTTTTGSTIDTSGVNMGRRNSSTTAY